MLMNKKPAGSVDAVLVTAVVFMMLVAKPMKMWQAVFCWLRMWRGGAQGAEVSLWWTELKDGEESVLFI